MSPWLQICIIDFCFLKLVISVIAIQEFPTQSQAHIFIERNWILRQKLAHDYVCLPNSGYIYPTYACSYCSVKRNININEVSFSWRGFQGVLFICQSWLTQHTLFWTDQMFIKSQIDIYLTIFCIPITELSLLGLNISIYHRVFCGEIKHTTFPFSSEVEISKRHSSWSFQGLFRCEE